MLYAGGAEELDAAYETAVSAIFERGVACHRHQKCYTSRKTGKRKYISMEMWPVADPLDGKLAVMVSEYNMTEQKELELQLSAQHQSLQRQVRQGQLRTVCMSHGTCALNAWQAATAAYC